MKNQYLQRNDKCQVALNHGIHGGRKGKVFGINEHCPVGTSEISTKVIIRCADSKELFDVDSEHVVKLDKNNNPVTHVEVKEPEKMKNLVFGGKSKQQSKDSYPDRIIDWGEWLRLDLNDGTTLIRAHACSSDRWANSGLVARLTRDGKLKEMHPKHRGWVVRPLESDENDWIFVGSLEAAEGHELPFRPELEHNEESVVCPHHEVSG
jgi:nitrite reductase/ring-hydroxylating ferredoxin subunit